MTTTGTTARPVRSILSTQSVIEGGGTRVHRPFPTSEADNFDPFLLLDEMAPTTYPPGGAGGVPPHPHRGFETVTYVFEGEIEHRDSADNHGIIGPGDVQWMTAGDGIVHSEMLSERLRIEGGTNHGIQLWVNLPAHLRRTTPRYQSLTSAQMPTVVAPRWRAHLVAGRLEDKQGPAHTHTPLFYAMVTVDPGATATIPVAEGHTALAYVINGTAIVDNGTQTASPQHLVVFESSRGDIVITAGDDTALRCLILAGEPINEPIVRYGPFVVNTTHEIRQAIDDFNSGQMGSIAANGGARRMHQPTDSNHATTSTNEETNHD